MSDDDVIPRSWLDARVTVEELEVASARAPQGDRWESFKRELQAGDEMWTFDSPLESWENHAGRMGVAIVRGGRVVLHLVTLMN